MPQMLASPGEIAAAIDWLLQERGRFDFVQLLHHLDLLEDAPGNVDDGLAVSRLRCIPAEAEALVRLAGAHADALGLLPTHPRRSAPLMQAMSSLRPAAYGLEESLRQLRERPIGKPQLDLFRDNRLLHIEAKLRSAVIEGRFDEAQSLIRQIPPSASAIETSNGWQTLIAASAAQVCNPADRLQQLEDELPALARRHLGAAANGYLQGLWRRLAVSSAGLAFDAAQPRLHASHAWLKVRDWQQVCDCIEVEMQWPSQPVLIQRLIEARQRLGAFHLSRRLWLSLCWQHPAVAETALEEGRGDATLNLHWQAFLDAEPVLEVADFPAWLLLVDHSQTHWQPPGDLPKRLREVYGALLKLIESGGAMDARRRLHDLHPSLLKHYLHGR